MSILELYRSPLIKKAVMAVTGVMLFGFVFTHMLGNLKLYGGPEKLNAYAEGLRELGKPILGHGEALLVMRGALIVAVLLHILSAYQLTRISQKARPVSYKERRPQVATYASRTMRWGGVIILLFVVYHLLHLTFGDLHPNFKPGDVYHNVVVGFQNPLVAGFYILANLALGLHLYHGVWSLFQSLGLSSPGFDVFRRRFAAVFAVLVVVANISFPLAVLSGVVKLGA